MRRCSRRKRAAKKACSVLERKFVRRTCPPCPPLSGVRSTQLVVGLSAANAGERHARSRKATRPPTEAEDGDYAAGALGVAALSLTAPHSVQASYGLRCAPCPRPQQACAMGEELKCAQHKPPQVNFKIGCVLRLKWIEVHERSAFCVCSFLKAVPQLWAKAQNIGRPVWWQR